MTGMLVVRLIGGPRDGEEVQCPSWRVDELRDFPGRAFDTVEVLEPVWRVAERGGQPPKIELPMDVDAETLRAR